MNVSTLNQNLQWFDKEENELPYDGHRVLVFSPMYSGKDSTMEFRVMDGRFVKLAADIEAWAYLNAPY